MIVIVLLALGILEAWGNNNTQGQNTNIRISNLRNYEECGGVIPINTMYSTIISHHNGAKAPDHVICTWILIPEGNITSVKLDVTWNPVFVGSGFLAYLWNDTGLTKVELPKGSFQWTFEKVPALLTFSHIADENGFTANFTSVGTYGLSRTNGFHFAKDEGSFSYPIQAENNYRSNERLIIVINTVIPRPTIQGNKQVILKIMYTEECFDFLDVYSLFFKTDPIQHGYIGRFSGNEEGLFTSNHANPTVFLFQSDKKVTGKGFSIQWRDVQQ